jgi:tricorn protease
VDANGAGEFERILADLPTNIESPMWADGRVYFLSDHEGVGNVCSCAVDGSDLRVHTQHSDFYARSASTDGRTIVYQAGAELYRLAVGSDAPERIAVRLASPRTQRSRRFVEAGRYLHGFAIHPQGHSLAVEARGKAFSMPLWEQAPRQWGERDGVRYRHGQWLHDGDTFAVFADDGDGEVLELREVGAAPGDEPRRLELDLGRPVEVVAAPKRRALAVTNHRCELVLVDADAGTATVLDRSLHGRIMDPAWSPDGRWVAYALRATQETCCIRLVEVDTGTVHDITRSEFADVCPSFDPEGKHLYFLSYRQFDPVYDSMVFALGFPRGVRPMLVTLRDDLRSPFEHEPRGLGAAAGAGAAKQERDGAAGTDAAAADAEHDADSDSGSGEEAAGEAPKGSARAGSEPLRIDLEGIQDRVLSFPMPDGKYTQVRGVKGKALFTAWDDEGALNLNWAGDPEPKGRLECFTFADSKHETLVSGISGFEVAGDGATLVYRAGRRLRALKAGEKPKSDAGDKSGRTSGWIDLSRLRVSVNPPQEWGQMLREAWRLQRDHFWTEHMSGVDWDDVLERYEPLVDKVCGRGEFSDLLWELQGELGTSHAYDMGGDYRPAPAGAMGHLGVDWRLDADTGRFHVAHVVRGDSWSEKESSPLAAPGVNVHDGDAVLAIGGQPVGAGSTAPGELLVHQAGQRVELQVVPADGVDARTVVVGTLRSEGPVRYRAWVNANRAEVHARTDGRVGYLHLPDMGPRGYSEFHRHLGRELERDALIVDVRYNGGGHVSQLLLEKLARKRIGYCVARWRQPNAYPDASPAGPIVAITNEKAGSDGDIFSHAFKMMGLGTLVGVRTWGGVIGINPSHRLADGSLTTQPEYSHWFADVGWGVENYGTDPDVPVEITPQDYAAGRDPQLDTSLELVLAALEANPPALPDFSERPNLAPPVLATR